MSPFEKRMLKKLDIKDLKKDSKIKLATIQKINRKDNTAVITNYKLKNKYIDLNILGYHFETGNLSIIKRHNESVPIELDRLKLFTKLEKDRNDNIVSFKEAKLVPRKNRSLRVDRATKMKFPIKRLSYEAVENLRKKKHETKKLTPLDTQYDIAVQSTYKGENFEALTQDFIKRIYSKIHIEKRLILKDK